MPHFIRHLVTGAAGFIGSHLVDRLLAEGHEVLGIDNLKLGRVANLKQALGNSKFKLIETDLADFSDSFAAVSNESKLRSFDTAWHLAANSDIRAGSVDPDVDLRDTFLTTYNLLKILQKLEIPSLAFASSSAIYGVHSEPLTEKSAPLFPISNYGAMKLASEGAISAALENYLNTAWIFRFPNVVGGRSTHGVIYDFMQKLQKNPLELEVLGDGSQDKPYFHVAELLDAMFFIRQNSAEKLNYFNIGTADSSTTVRYIAEAVVRRAAPAARIRYTGGSKGWVGDVPKFSYSTEKLKQLGWAPKLTSRQAVDRAVSEIAGEMGL